MAQYLTMAGLQTVVTQIDNKYATKDSVPTKTSDLTNDSDFQTGTEVASAISTAIAGVTQFDYEVVASLPASGVKGTIYLVAAGSGSNTYNEYIWVNNQFESLGPQTVEATQYVGDGTNIQVTDGSGANAGKKVIDLTSTAANLLNNALQGVTSANNTIIITGNGTTKNLEVSSTIAAGAAAGATALQPSDVQAITDEAIEALFA